MNGYSDFDPPFMERGSRRATRHRLAMRIFITNDDGVGAEGLMASSNALSGSTKSWCSPRTRSVRESPRAHVGEAQKVREVTACVFTCSGTPIRLRPVGHAGSDRLPARCRSYRG